jgi:stage II sporulation protein AA (anti-sigma F factor antagonist)
MLEPTVTSTRLDGVAIVALHGEHDLSTADGLRCVVRDHLADFDARIVVDLTDATFIDSSVLNVILASHNQSDGGAAVVLIAPPDSQPRAVLDLAHTGDFIPVLPIRELGIDALTHRSRPRHARA